ncbi:hypothetical protein KBC04_02820 [Candidatus Babeliales bacterium]|nr:hypothetical protein [Candidatus Babeliales bacterium]MBP9844014.1 hypothetical protein [Candidatus Babeliales bacterium]
MKYIHSRYITILFFMQCLLFLPGCTLLEWSDNTFRQAEPVSKHFALSMEPFIQSLKIYDQLVTIADFSAMFLTDEARMIYADYFFHRNFKTPEEQELDRERLLKENDYYITFYVIGNQPATIFPSGRALFSGEYQVRGPLLGTADAHWKITMAVDGKEYGPCDVRSISLPAEYQHFFGIHWSQFKSAYKVRFDARDQNGDEILPIGNHRVQLKFNSVTYNAVLEWKTVSYQIERPISEEN